MSFVFLNELLNVNWTHVIASTLLHSIWEGTLAAIVSGLIVITTKKCRATVRYNLHSFVFLFFIIAVAYTFFREMRSESVVPVNAGTIADYSNIKSDQIAIVSDASYNGLNTAYLVLQINYFLSKYAPLIVFVWLIVFFVKFCSIITGMHYICRLRKLQSKPVTNYWRHRLDILACKIGVTQHIALLESGKVCVPMVIGYFKPVIVIPLGLICKLPIPEMEAILLHELAHIRRNDYVVNLLQSVAENIFFFHPCILWISSLIREERENCCDDIAVQVTNNKEQYIHALISFQEYNLAVSAAPAIAFAGTRHRLLDRARRLLNHENKKLNQMEKMILMGSMVVLTSICVISSNDSQAQQRPHRESYKREEYRSEKREGEKQREELVMNDGKFRHVSTNTTFKDGDRVITITVVDEDDRTFRLKNVNGKTESLSIDGNEIDEDDFSEYMDVIKNIERVSAVATEKSKLQRQRSQESESIRELRKEEQRRQAWELAAHGDQKKQKAEKLMYRKMQEQDQENNIRNRESYEREETSKAEQHRLREMLEAANEVNRNQNRNQDLEDQESNDLLKRKFKSEDQQQLREQLRERELLQRVREEDMQLRKIEQQRNQDMLGRAREMHQRDAARIAQQRKLQQKHYYDQLYRNRDIQQRNLESIQEQRKADQEIYRNQRDRQREVIREYKTNSMPKPKSYQLVKPRLSINKQGNDNSNHEISGIIGVLEEEELIDSPDHISFTLTDEHLIVNGRRQSSDVHERLRDKYIRKQGDHYSYFKEGNTTRTTIHRN